MDDLETKLQTGYVMVTALADHRRDLSQKILEAVDSARGGSVELSQSTFIECLRLAIRTYAGLLPARLESSQDFERLARLIDSATSRVLRIRLWQDFAIRCASSKHSDAKRIVLTKMMPLLESLKKESEYDWLESMVYAAPALYVSNALTTLDTLKKLPSHWRERAIDALCHYKLTGMPAGEPFSKGEGTPYNLDFDSCREIVQLNRELTRDSTIAFNMTAIAESATWKHNKNSFTQDQKNILSEEIRELTKTTLPSPSGIQHEGFALLCEAQAMRLKREKFADWDPLIMRARNLGNISDCVFVLVYLADALHQGTQDRRRELLVEAHKLTKEIPSAGDRVERIELIASVAINVDKAFTKTLLIEAADFLKTPAGEDEDRGIGYRRIIDLAFQVDPDLAASLASSLDGDEGRREARRRIAYQRLKENIRSPDARFEHDEEVTSAEMASATWDLLGQLNAGRVVPREVASSMDALKNIAECPLERSFPIMSWVIANAIARRGHADEAKNLLREMFEAMLSTSEMAVAVVSRAAGRSKATLNRLSADAEGSVLIAAGERQKAIGIIANWMKANLQDSLIVCDPYFGPKDLEFLQLVLSNKPESVVTIITSRKQQDMDHVTDPYAEFYADYWRKHFSEQDPPRTEFVIVGGASGELPIHDRWILGHESGLRLGTSLNGLGTNKDSEISVLNHAEIESRREESFTYIKREKREHLNHRLTYQFFDLPL